MGRRRAHLTMTLKQLEAFYWAARLGTFAIAAQRLHVTQSTLSKRIAELESDVGESLFDRGSRRAMLTRAGEALVDKARQMLDIEQEIRSSLGQPDELRGTCRFGLSELVATTWFPSLAACVSRDYPQVSLEPRVGLARSLERAVARGELDVATIAGPPTLAAIRSQSIADVEFVWTAAPGRLAAGTVLRPHHFVEHPMIDNPLDSGLSEFFRSWAAANGVRVERTITCNSRAAIIALTVAGVGLSFQPAQYVSPLFVRGLLVPLRSDPPLPSLAYHFISRQDDNRHLVDRFRDLTAQVADFSAGNQVWI